MSDNAARHLRLALETFERHEEEAALGWLLEAWRQVRAERIAVLAERVTTRFNPSSPRPGLFDRPSELESLVKFADRSSPQQLGRRLGGRALRKADPRFTPALLSLAARPEARDGAVFHPLCELLIRVNDPRSLEPLRALHASLPPDSPYARRLGEANTLIAQAPAPSLEADASALCDALEEALARREEVTARSTPLREEFLARIAANPDDDEARLVLADHLLEHGDPLGEFIMLQCQPQPDAERVARLLRLHGAKWEKQLSPWAARGHTRFERGLPVAAQLRVSTLGCPPPPGPFWGTVRELDFDWTGGSEELVDWLAHPHLRGVTVLRRVNGAIAYRLGRHPLPLRRIEMQGSPPGMVNLKTGRPVEDVDVFAPLSALPHLAWVEVRSAWARDVRWCASALGERLERFEANHEDCETWSLTVTRSDAVPVEATLLNGGHREEMAEAIRAAAGFSIRGLRIRTQLRLTPDTLRMLEEASSGYMHVEWELPPGSR
ncbi:TIGR02996 domain-containing protein [Pyxidicoccus xibeiensis]|uniref:TIGR02996 domain-containing protein n=1 Tax=Pyxidicoccus xibeiensis TaxID=2906759 RepID=UPI0020A83439|nr:TIGR02996 domain-containing protein [Pyxidicoccus xibeiensis]MCP3143596.1 TIGR02996 domain-containing protein [Pyxidicoccus xibeiensis]